MDALRHVRLMADYNRWMNRRLVAACGGLPADALVQDRGAYFGSVLGTLNHLAVADSLWLHRFEHPGHWDTLHAALEWLPKPIALRETLAADLASFAVLRERLDTLIVDWCDELKFNDLDRVLAYRNMAGEARQRQLGPLLSHFFNHQTHHRGQATTLLFQAGVDPGVTDLIALPGSDPFAVAPAAVPDAPADSPAA